MPFLRNPYRLSIRSFLDLTRNTPLHEFPLDATVLVRYVPGVNDPVQAPVIEHVLLNGTDELEKKWWTLQELNRSEKSRTFALTFHAKAFGNHIRQDPCRTDQALYEALIDQATIVLKVNMGPVKLEAHEDHCKAPGDHVASLFVALEAELRDVKRPT